jgi:hypothetical protein
MYSCAARVAHAQQHHLVKWSKKRHRRRAGAAHISAAGNALCLAARRWRLVGVTSAMVHTVHWWPGLGARAKEQVLAEG